MLRYLALFLGFVYRKHPEDGTGAYVARTATARARFFGKDEVAYVVGNTAYYRSLRAFRDARTRRHELTHLAQRRRLGAMVYEIAYWYMAVVYGYQKNPFEKEARASERRVNRRRR